MIDQRQWILLLLGIAIGVIGSIAAFSRRTLKNGSQKTSAKLLFTLTSPSFKSGEDIPSQFTCDDQDISPELQWHNPPSGTQSFVLTCHDPDAIGGTWIHWIMFDIPATMSQLSQQFTLDPENKIKFGINSWGNTAYGGPCPPLKKHRYFFTLYALDIPEIPVEGSPEIKQIAEAMRGHVLGKAKLLGKYQRLKNK